MEFCNIYLTLEYILFYTIMEYFTVDYTIKLNYFKNNA